jgi:hypothetical protein
METNMSEAAETLAVPELPHVRLIANGYAYDTSTATIVYHWDCYDGLSSLDECPFSKGEITETLYRTKRYRWDPEEHYFLVSRDAMSPEDETTNNDKALTREQAIDWASKRCNGMVEKLFGKLPEPGQATAYMRIG